MDFGHLRFCRTFPAHPYSFSQCPAASSVEEDKCAQCTSVRAGNKAERERVQMHGEDKCYRELQHPAVFLHFLLHH